MKRKQNFAKKSEVIERTPDKAVREMLIHAEKAGIETTFDRFDAQKPLCGFGLDGTCCKNCHIGPCKITPKSPRGTCGADAHLIVARNLLRWTAAGVAAHGHSPLLVAIVKVADELIAHNILALTNGCAAYALLNSWMSPLPPLMLSQGFTCRTNCLNCAKKRK